MPYAHKIEPDSKVCLSDFDTRENAGLSKQEGREITDKLGAELGKLQELLFASSETPILLVLQGRDTSGKDGTIKNLLKYINVHSCRVAPFGVPTKIELDHDFLWRIHRETPAKGEMAIFNRSHYEDVLVVRVRNLAPEKVWKKRFDHINDFERMLDDSGTLILKFFLHISKEEQKNRLISREEDATKSWKLSVGDWKDRALWDDYTKAYEDVIKRCNTSYAPWYVVPADRKWYRNLAITECLVNAIKPFESKWMKQLEALGERARAELEEYRAANPDA